MTDITISKKNESFINIDCDIGILQELSDFFTFYVEGYKHMPKFRAGVWDGKIRLLDMRFGTLPAGLTTELVEYSKKLGYSISFKPNNFGVPNEKTMVDIETLKKWIFDLNIHTKINGLETRIDVRDYQVEAIYNCIHNQRQVSVTPTGGGKSLIAYCLYRWYLEHDVNHFLLVVPTLNLVKQMYSDFKEYSKANGFDIEANTQIIADGADKNINKSLIISTWQSIYKIPSKWFNDIDCILMDECHQCKSDAIKGIFEKAINVKYRFGVTGSLDKSAVNKLVINGMIGDISKVKTTRELINEGHLSDIKITCIILRYNKESKALIKSADYQTEIDFLCQHKNRNTFISKLALSRTGNSLILFNYIEKHGVPLYEEIKYLATTQKVHFVSGKVEAEDRERIRLLVQDSTENNIIVASCGTFSTGLNLPRIHNIIFATPTKSVIRVMQSIGRGLRRSKDKDYLRLYDIADNIVPSKYKPNATMRHFLERLRIYNEEEHPYKIIEEMIE